MFSNLKKIVMWIITVCYAVFIVTFSLANRTSIEIDIWPLPIKQQVPLFALLLACVGIGILWGGFAAWLSAGTTRRKTREATRRADAAELKTRHAEDRCSQLEQDLRVLKAQEKTNQDQQETSGSLRIPSNADAA